MIKVSTEAISAGDPFSARKSLATTDSSQQYLTQRIIAQANQSANWHTNKLLILALGLPCALIATLFSLAGAWVLLPYVGLEITGISAALYIVCRRLQHRHVLVFKPHQLSVEKGCHQPEQIWIFSLETLSIGVERQTHPWDAPRIKLYGKDPSGHYQQVSIGDFLNKQDSQKLLRALQRQGLRIRNDSVLTRINV